MLFRHRKWWHGYERLISIPTLTVEEYNFFIVLLMNLLQVEMPLVNIG
jgi:hypothetical protein